MHFTKSQIEEIRRRIAIQTRKDSEFSDAVIPLDGTERIPVIQYFPAVQDYENRLLSLADLRSLVLADQDQTSVACLLTVSSSTEDAVITINGAERSLYSAYYGEIVDVSISADGYVTWYGAITMTQDHSLSVALQKASEGISLDDHGTYYTLTIGNQAVDLYSKSQVDALLEKKTTTYTVCVLNDQGATITINDNQVASGSINTFAEGTRIVILVSKTGYNSAGYTIPSLSEDFTTTITLTEAETPDVEDTYLRFNPDSVVQLDALGTVVTTHNVLTNNPDLTWKIDVGEEIEEASSSDPVPESGESIQIYPESLVMSVGDTWSDE